MLQWYLTIVYDTIVYSSKFDMSDHANQSQTTSSPVSVYLSVSADPIKVESIAQTSSDDDRTLSDEDIPSSQPDKRQRVDQSL